MKNKFVTKYTLIALLLVTQNCYSQDSFILNYEDVDIRKVTQDIAQFTKRTIILDPRVKGKITIYSNANLDKKQISTFVDISAIAPGVNVAKNEGFKTVITIRGVGYETNQNAIATPSVSYHLDGIYIVLPKIYLHYLQQ